MPLQPLTYTRDAATGPTLTAGGAEAVWMGGGSGLTLPPPHPLKSLLPTLRLARSCGLTYGLAVPSGMAGPLCFRAFTSHDNSTFYKQQ